MNARRSGNSLGAIRAAFGTAIGAARVS